MTEPTRDVASDSSLMPLVVSVAKHVQIVGVRLVESYMKREISSDADIPGSVELAYRFSVEHCYAQETKQLDVIAKFRLDGISDDGDGNERRDIFHVRASFLLMYLVKGNDELTEPQVSAFAKVNGVHNAWPYWREYVQSSVERMGLPSVVMPVITGQAIERMVLAGDAKSESRPVDAQDKKEPIAEEK